MKKGFSLTELLVVIAIIAILAALLFPVFSRAKVAAKQSVDIVQLNQIGKAHLLYCGDYDDTTPYVGDLGIFAALESGQLNYADVPEYFGQQSIVGALQPFLKSTQIWKSDLDPGDRVLSPSSTYELLGSSYEAFSRNFCVGQLTNLSDPSQSTLIRRNFTENGKTLGWRADGSVAVDTWSVVTGEIDRAMIDLGCP